LLSITPVILLKRSKGKKKMKMMKRRRRKIDNFIFVVPENQTVKAFND
jgi:uncharacterized membrane protein YobD (UPF0266 family)